MEKRFSLNICLIVLVLVSALSNAQDEEFNFKESKTVITQYDVLNNLGAPRYKRQDDRIQLGNRSFSFKSGEVQFVTRYGNKVLAAVTRKKSSYIISSHGRRSISTNLSGCKSTLGNGSLLSSTISYDHKPICLTSRYYFDGNQRYSLPAKAVSAVFGHNPKGDVISAFVGKDKQIYIGKKDHYIPISVGLNQSSDLNDIINVYPISNSSFLLSVYVYENKLNKSVWVYHINHSGPTKSHDIKRKLVHNNKANHKGLNPQLAYDNGTVYVSSQAGLSRWGWAFHQSNIDNQNSYYNTHSGPDMFSLVAGVGVYQQYRTFEHETDASDQAKPEAYQKAVYNLEPSLMTEYRLEGKIFNRPLAVSYIKQKIREDLSKTEAAAIERLYGYIGLFDNMTGAEGLRLTFSEETVNGSIEYSPADNQRIQQAITDKKRSFGLAYTFNQGQYVDFTYSRSQYPAEVLVMAQSERDDILYFDPNLKIKAFDLSFGYDHLQFTSRYNMDTNTFYVSGEGTLGVAHYSLPPELTSLIQQSFSDRPSSELLIRFGAELELGYLMQARSYTMKGLGGALQFGYRASYLGYGAGGDREEMESDELYQLNFDATEVIHGPFARASLLW